MSTIHVAMKGQSKIFCILYLPPSDFRTTKIISFLSFIFLSQFSLLPLSSSCSSPPDSPICFLTFQRPMRDSTSQLRPSSTLVAVEDAREITPNDARSPHTARELRASSSLSCRLVARRQPSFSLDLRCLTELESSSIGAQRSTASSRNSVLFCRDRHRCQPPPSHHSQPP